VPSVTNSSRWSTSGSTEPAQANVAPSCRTSERGPRTSACGRRSTERSVRKEGDPITDPKGGAVQTTVTEPETTEIVTRTEATFQFTAQTLPDALSFDGGDRVTVAHSASLALAGSSTVEVRFRYDPDPTGAFRALVHKTSANPLFRTFSLFVNQTTGTLFFDTWDDAGQQFWHLNETS